MKERQLRRVSVLLSKSVNRMAKARPSSQTPEFACCDIPYGYVLLIVRPGVFLEAKKKAVQLFHRHKNPVRHLNTTFLCVAFVIDDVVLHIKFTQELSDTAIGA